MSILEDRNRYFRKSPEIIVWHISVTWADQRGIIFTSKRRGWNNYMGPCHEKWASTELRPNSSKHPIELFKNGSSPGINIIKALGVWSPYAYLFIQQSSKSSCGSLKIAYPVCRNSGISNGDTLLFQIQYLSATFVWSNEFGGSGNVSFGGHWADGLVALLEKCLLPYLPKKLVQIARQDLCALSVVRPLSGAAARPSQTKHVKPIDKRPGTPVANLAERGRQLRAKFERNPGARDTPAHISKPVPTSGEPQKLQFTIYNQLVSYFTNFGRFIKRFQQKPSEIKN